VSCGELSRMVPPIALGPMALPIVSSVAVRVKPSVSPGKTGNSSAWMEALRFPL